jgi:hypothetical protein
MSSKCHYIIIYLECKFDLPGAKIACIPTGCLVLFCLDYAANKHHIYVVRIICSYK